MEYDISIDHENNIVWAQCRGSMDMTEAVPMTEEVRAQALELGYHPIYDMTEASPRISLSKAYAFQRNIKDLYADIRRTVDGYAKENGYTVVVMELSRKLGRGKVEDMIKQINNKAVVFSAKEIDITEEIITAMNR